MRPGEIAASLHELVWNFARVAQHRNEGFSDTRCEMRDARLQINWESQRGAERGDYRG